MVAILALSLIFLQQQFSAADDRKAIQLLASTEPGAHWSIGQELVARSPNGSPDCHSTVLSSFRGTIEVSCATGDGQRYRFEVDLVRQSVQPIDNATRQLMNQVAEKKNGPVPSTSDAGR